VELGDPVPHRDLTDPAQNATLVTLLANDAHLRITAALVAEEHAGNAVTVDLPGSG
jgi:hypothetical protein